MFESVISNAITAAGSLTGAVSQFVVPPREIVDLSRELLDRIDRMLEQAGAIDEQAGEVNAKLPVAIEELRATGVALGNASVEIAGLGVRLDKFELLAERIAEMEAHVALMNEHLVQVLRLAQPIGGAQEAAQRFRDSLRIGSRRRKDDPSESE